MVLLSKNHYFCIFQLNKTTDRNQTKRVITHSPTPHEKDVYVYVIMKQTSYRQLKLLLNKHCQYMHSSMQTPVGLRFHFTRLFLPQQRLTTHIRPMNRAVPTKTHSLTHKKPHVFPRAFVCLIFPISPNITHECDRLRNDHYRLLSVWLIDDMLCYMSDLKAY